MKLQAATLLRRAGTLAGHLPKATAHPAVLNWTVHSRSRTPWVVALSGGMDSVALLLFVWAHWPERRQLLRAVHYNHRMRGRASDGDEKFCRELCRLLQVPLWVGRSRTGSVIKNEAQARELRFACINRLMDKAGAHALWLGHQQNDVAETMLMRLARSSGAGGLAAPRPVQNMPMRRVHLRPLLNLSRGKIETAMLAARLPYRTDGTNLTGVYFRNRIRLDVLPVWMEAAGRDVISGVARARELLEEDDAALEEWTTRLQANMAPRRLDLNLCKDVPRAVLRRLLHRWLLAQADAGELSRQAFDRLLDALEKGEPTRHSIGVRGFAVIKHRELTFQKNVNYTRKTDRR
ncbi:MAG: tRNA lysidine(34) synthetase TilS [Cephaloticoccus sp.]|nr:tRNA lysidine(34) synthetase TilS [Cephaloticoccus sp.]MCF7759422.1 tRNA lysidine(34) synthetase TilS [Cephaloticoccus sp.]